MVPLNITTSYVILDNTTSYVAQGVLYYSSNDDEFMYISDYLQADTRLLQTLFLGMGVCIGVGVCVWMCVRGCMWPCVVHTVSPSASSILMCTRSHVHIHTYTHLYTHTQIYLLSLYIYIQSIYTQKKTQGKQSSPLIWSGSRMMHLAGVYVPPASQ